MKTEPSTAALAQLLDIMARLRDRERGCPWDLEQTFATIAPYTIEEAYEVADAIERGDLGELKDELGDLLFQVVFHARMAEELAEVDSAAAANDADEVAAELGDLLFSIANWCRHLQLDPETCLRAANERFARRFRAVEAEVAASGKPWSSHDAAELDALWRHAKAALALAKP